MAEQVTRPRLAAAPARHTATPHSAAPPARTNHAARRYRRVPPSGWAMLGLIAAAVLAPAVAGFSQTDVDLAAVLQRPSGVHLLGTDDMGRDMLLRTLAGLRVSLVVGLVAAAVAGGLGTAVGVLAGARGGWVDRVLMRLVDAVASVPHLLLGIFIVALFRPSVGAVVASVALTHWVSTARIVRARLLALRERPHVEAAISAGAGRWQLVRHHHLPAVAPEALLAAGLMVPHAVMHESALSFLGLGLPPHLASLGTMVAAGQSALLAGAWWPAVVPGVAIIALGLLVIRACAPLRSRFDDRATEDLRW